MRTMRWMCLLLLAFPAAAATAQGEIATRGTVTHRPADAHFPERIGDFQRSNVRQYDSAGEDISASYWLVRDDDQLLVTIYIYPSGRRGTAGSREEQCEEEFEGVGAAIVGHHASARLADEGAAPAVEGVPPALARRAIYRMEADFAGRTQPVRSEAWLYCFVTGRWQVKYRATSNAAFDGSADVEQLLRSGPWPGRAAPPDTVAALTDTAATP